MLARLEEGRTAAKDRGNRGRRRMVKGKRQLMLLGVMLGALGGIASARAEAAADGDHAPANSMSPAVITYPAYQFNPQAPGVSGSYPCNSTYGSVIVPASNWDSQIQSTGHDGAGLDVKSNLKSGSCDRAPSSSDGTNMWGIEYQCTELAVRVADAEWALGGSSAWGNAGWNGAADDMFAHHPSQLTAIANNSGSLPVPGDLLVWSSSGGSDPGHVAVVAAVGGGNVTFVGENQGDGMVVIPYSGSNVENSGWKTNSSIVGWLHGTSGGPAVGVDSTGATYVYWKGADNNLWEGFWNGSQFVGPYDRGMGPLGSEPSVAITANATAFVFWKGTDGNLWEAQGSAKGSLSGPYGRGMGPLGSGPTVGVDGTGATYMYWRGADNHLWEGFWNGSQFVGPYDRGMGPLGSAPSVAITGNATAFVFWKGTDSNLWEAQGSATGSLAGPYSRGMGPLG
jgi:hypothetical protein